MTCLNDSHIQALADGEGDARAAAHAAGCARCAERVRARMTLMAGIQRSLDLPVDMPASVSQRVEEIFQPTPEGATTGATRLRVARGVPAFRFELRGRGWIYSAVAVAAATILAVLFIVPAVRKAD